MVFVGCLGNENAIRGFFRRLGAQRRRPAEVSKGNAVAVPEHIEWIVWRVVGNRIATLEEIDRHYDLIDLLDANETLDLFAEAERAAIPKPPRR